MTSILSFVPHSLYSLSPTRGPILNPFMTCLAFYLSTPQIAQKPFKMTEDYTAPKGTMIVPSVWAACQQVWIHHVNAPTHMLLTILHLSSVLIP